jgi:nicotinamidase-related amidase
LTGSKVTRSKYALVLVDFFNPRGFAGLGTARAVLQAARNTARLKARLRRASIPVIYANDNFGQWASEFTMLVAACRGRAGPPGEVAALLAPQQGDLSILKPRHSAFFGTPLDFLLEELSTKVLILAGVSADSCIMFTAHDAYLRKFKLWVPGDCVASTTPAHTRAALRHIGRVLRASTARSTDKLP